ncbi:MAG TPA: hypothetical protein VKX31_03550 [Brumimicrobium sp.]|nr:hypothetical protein [Brumimicrobium sp.]
MERNNLFFGYQVIPLIPETDKRDSALRYLFYHNTLTKRLSFRGAQQRGISFLQSQPTLDNSQSQQRGISFYNYDLSW